MENNQKDQDDDVFRQISESFFDTEEYGDFQVADTNFRSGDPDFLKENQNKNTKRKTDSDMRLFLSFCMFKNEVRKPEFLPPDILNILLCEPPFLVDLVYHILSWG
jgi:hypothetical protein